MPDSMTNRGRYRSLEALRVALGANSYMLVLKGSGVAGLTTAQIADLNTLADLDAITNVDFHTERLALTSGATTEDDANDRAALDYGNLSFAAAAGISAAGIAWYDNTNATDATRELLAVYTTGFPQPMDGGLNVTIADVVRGS